MTVLKVIGVLAGVSIIALIGGGFYLAYKAKKGFKTLIDEVKDRIPTNPEKRPKDGETDEPPFRPKPSGLIMDTGDVPPELKAALDELFTDFWPPSDEVIDNLTDEDVVVFAVESEPVGNYTQTRQEGYLGQGVERRDHTCREVRQPASPAVGSVMLKASVWVAPCFVLAVLVGAACPSGGSSSPLLDRGVCETLIECASSIAPEAEAQYEAVYGEGGSCWTNDPRAWEACRMACRDSLDALNLSGMVTGMTCGTCEVDGDCVGVFGPGAVCDAGLCVGGDPNATDSTSGETNDTGDTNEFPEGDPAFGIDIAQVEANQGSGVLIGQAGQWVGPTERNAPLVAGRETLIRLQHTVDDNWTPRDIGAILHLRDAQGTELSPLGQTLFVDGPSDPDDLDTQFHFTLSAAESEVGLSYQVELVDVGGSNPVGLVPGINTTPSDFALIGYDPSPVELHVVLVPFAYTYPNTPTYPTLDDADLQLIADELYQAHPVQSVNLEVRTAHEQSEQINHPAELLPILQNLRAQDGAAPNVYYQGLIDVGAALLGGVAGAGQLAGARQGQADARVAVTVWVSASESAREIVHELGHNHGLAHVACPNEVTEAVGPDPSYPYAGGSIGVHGYAVLDGILYAPSNTADTMTHCFPRWASDWTWAKVHSRLVELSSW